VFKTRVVRCAETRLPPRVFMSSILSHPTLIRAHTGRAKDKTI
jgi:hypothetical protein